MSPQAPEPAAASSDRSYLRLLALLLGTATFFEGYDAGIAAVVIPDLVRDFHASTALLGRAAAVVNLGAMVALFVIAASDRVGRRPVLIATTVLYAAFTALTATAHSVAGFAAIQFVARTFLVAELALAITIATEEFPADRRGRTVGTLSVLGAVGLVTVAVAYRLLAHTALGWRGLYVFGAIPLLAAAPLRARLRESRRWLEARARGPRPGGGAVRTVLAGTYRGRLLTVSGLLFCFNLAVLSGSAYWTLFARDERGLPPNTANAFLAGAFVLGLPGYVVAGRLQDRWGRRRTGTLFMLAGMASGVAAFQAHGRVPMFAALTCAVFFGLGGNPVVSTLASEVFPTEVRATAVAIARSVFGTLGASSGLLAVGLLAARHGVIGNVGDSVSVAATALIVAVALLWRLPETAGLELETIAPAPPRAR
ncbi:MAG TPA: MFS transporter [Actinomycetota bacterium]|nr:MFS transporter [Actinomycetota bacterium]